jgi:hypothetical protein
LPMAQELPLLHFVGVSKAKLETEKARIDFT